MRTTDYLAAAMRKSGSQSKAQFAYMLGLTRSTITMYESGGRVMDDYTAARVAEILEIDPMMVIAQANAEREKDEGRRNYWQRMAARTVAQAASVALAVVVLFATGDAETSIASVAWIGLAGHHTNYG